MYNNKDFIERRESFMKKILKQTLATVLTMIVLFGAVPLGALIKTQ